MIRVAFETPRLRVIRPRPMARLAIRNPGNQHVARFRTRQRLRVTARASKSRVRVVAEFRMGQPAYCHVCRCHRRQDSRRICSADICHRAGIAPRRRRICRAPARDASIRQLLLRHLMALRARLVR